MPLFLVARDIKPDALELLSILEVLSRPRFPFLILKRLLLRDETEGMSDWLASATDDYSLLYRLGFTSFCSIC